MENKINLVELLKDCPKGMELDCTMFDNVTYDGIYPNDTLNTIPIKVGEEVFYLTKYGEWFFGDTESNTNRKCVIFPKGKTTWEGFHRPFVDGDIVATKDGRQIFVCRDKQYCYFGWDLKDNELFEAGLWSFWRHATKEEKRKLFDTIKDNGYKWNEETKILEKLPKFKDGDWIVTDKGDVVQIAAAIPDYYILNNGMRFSASYVDKYWHLWDIQDAKDGDMLAVTMYPEGTWVGIFKEQDGCTFSSYCFLSTDGIFKKGTYNHGNGKAIRPAIKEQCDLLFQKMKEAGYKWNADTKTLEKLIEPKFKVGNKIKNKNSGICDKVIKIFEDCYLVESCLDEQATIGFDIQDNWELVPNKFDINTLKPFDKVLCRDSSEDIWTAGFYSHFETQELSSYYVVNGTGADQCIPYEGNEHLLGKTDDCDDYYKTWEE